MTFNSNQYSKLKSRLKLKYQRRQKTVLKQLQDTPLKRWMADHRKSLAEYNTLHWYFQEQALLEAFFQSKTDDLSTAPDFFGKVDDEVFEKWNKSEFADYFLKSINQGKALKKASQDTLVVLDRHLVTWAQRHLERVEVSHRHYRYQTSLGEIERGGNISRLLSTTLHLQGKDLQIMTPTLKEMKKVSLRIEVALKVIQKFSPDSWERFKAFTDVIIPIKQKQFVSYSHQELPGYSMINLGDRDFVDLMDDLLHENGHHHLNYYLNLGKLIDEPQDFIYYSPWRRTARPLRGLYHAYFTFFWAFKLFSDLAKSKEMDSIWYLFSKTEKEKIYWRAVEEFHMLDYSYEELKWARHQGLIKKSGWDLIQEQRMILQKFKKQIPSWERKLKTHRSDLKELKSELKAARKDFQKS